MDLRAISDKSAADNTLSCGIVKAHLFESVRKDAFPDARPAPPSGDRQKKMDRRTRKTRKSIQNALMQLSVDKRINEITVTDVTQAADINRSTFYLHYNSVY